jgi:hypothetical protein
LRPAIELPLAAGAWRTPAFGSVLEREIEALGGARLPLQQGLVSTSYALDGEVEVMLITAAEAAEAIHARVGVFFSGITAGCNCAGDPTPVEPQPEYGELNVTIDKASARATLAPVAE